MDDEILSYFRKESIILLNELKTLGESLKKVRIPDEEESKKNKEDREIWNNNENLLWLRKIFGYARTIITFCRNRVFWAPKEDFGPSS